MSVMSPYSRSLLYGARKDYTGSSPSGVAKAPEASPAEVSGPNQKTSSRSGAPRVFQYIHDAATDTVKPAGAYRADAYIASCATAQYKTLANPRGMYESACTEGASAGAADQARELANLASFRQMHRGKVATYGDYYETRKMGTGSMRLLTFFLVAFL